MEDVCGADRGVKRIDEVEVGLLVQLQLGVQGVVLLKDHVLELLGGGGMTLFVE